jgi:hypothetical protein
MIELIAPGRFANTPEFVIKKLKPADQAIQLIVCVIQIDTIDESCVPTVMLSVRGTRRVLKSTGMRSDQVTKSID